MCNIGLIILFTMISMKILKQTSSNDRFLYESSQVVRLPGKIFIRSRPRRDQFRNFVKDQDNRESWFLQQRCKNGWSTGALLPEGNGPNHSWQIDSSQIYRTCCDFYKRANICSSALGPMKNRLFLLLLIFNIKVLVEYMSISKENILKYRKIPSGEVYVNIKLLYIPFSCTG